MSVGTEREAGLAGEERLPIHVRRSALLHHTQHLGKYASHRPHVDSLSVVLLQKNELRRTVPSGNDVAGQLSFHVFSHVFGGLELVHELLAAVDGGLRFFFGCLRGWLLLSWL